MLVSRLAAALVWMLPGWCGSSHAQTPTACGANGYRTVTRSWDAVLRRGWEARQECAHLNWPLRLVEMSSADTGAMGTGGITSANRVAATAYEKFSTPLLVKAGDVVRLRMQDDTVRIEMTGVVERSGRQGDHVVVQVTRQDDDAGLTIRRIAGTVSGTDEVEMTR